MSLVTLDPATDLPVPFTPGELAARSNWPSDGIAALSIRPVLRVFGISQGGEFYEYGDTPATPGPVVPALCGVITTIEVVSRGEASRYGLRDYLELRLATPDPAHQLLLRLPCNQGQWSYRSLLGALEQLDLQATALKLEAVRGRAATFIAVALDPEGLQRIKADAIGPDRSDLEISVNRLRAALGLPPQFV